MGSWLALLCCAGEAESVGETMARYTGVCCSWADDDGVGLRAKRGEEDACEEEAEEEEEAEGHAEAIIGNAGVADAGLGTVQEADEDDRATAAEKARWECSCLICGFCMLNALSKRWTPVLCGVETESETSSIASGTPALATPHAIEDCCSVEGK